MLILRRSQLFNLVPILRTFIDGSRNVISESKSRPVMIETYPWELLQLHSHKTMWTSCRLWASKPYCAPHHLKRSWIDSFYSHGYLVSRPPPPRKKKSSNKKRVLCRRYLDRVTAQKRVFVCF